MIAIKILGEDSCQLQNKSIPLPLFSLFQKGVHAKFSSRQIKHLLVLQFLELMNNTNEFSCDHP